MKLLLTTFLLSLACFAANAEWVLTSTSDAGTAYADPTTKKRTGNVVRIWESITYSKPQVIAGLAYQSTRTYKQYDCAEKISQTLQVTTFSGKMMSGEVVMSDAQPYPKEFVAPGSNVAAMLNFACK